MPPTSTKAIVLVKAEDKEKLHDAKLVDQPIPQLKSHQVLVRVHATAFNHRDLWIRKNQYPGIVFGSVLGADAAGTVVSSGQASDYLLNKRVFLTPSRGWKSDPFAPEERFGIVGGGAHPPIGTFTEHVVVERSEIIQIPDHLLFEEAAAWPLAGLTAWRAFKLAQLRPGQTLLITGVGGGVALIALQLALAMGIHVYITSGTKDKLSKAVSLGAKGGADYKSSSWPEDLAKQFKKDGSPGLTAIIDSGGGDILGKASRLLLPGARVVCYGMTAEPKMTFTMREVVRNVQLLGTAMGSRKDMDDATAFLAKHKIKPIVSHVLDGLEEAEEGFELMQSHGQFGKIVMRVRPQKQEAKL